MTKTSTANALYCRKILMTREKYFTFHRFSFTHDLGFCFDLCSSYYALGILEDFCSSTHNLYFFEASNLAHLVCVDDPGDEDWCQGEHDGVEAED